MEYISRGIHGYHATFNEKMILPPNDLGGHVRNIGEKKPA
jgi:hypothetical protein